MKSPCLRGQVGGAEARVSGQAWKVVVGMVTMSQCLSGWLVLNVMMCVLQLRTVLQVSFCWLVDVIVYRDIRANRNIR